MSLDQVLSNPPLVCMTYFHFVSYRTTLCIFTVYSTVLIVPYYKIMPISWLGNLEEENSFDCLLDWMFNDWCIRQTLPVFQLYLVICFLKIRRKFKIAISAYHHWHCEFKSRYVNNIMIIIWCCSVLFRFHIALPHV